jgi:hypothetical protein
VLACCHSAAAVRTWRCPATSHRTHSGCATCATCFLCRALQPCYCGWLGGEALPLGDDASHSRRPPVGHGDSVTRRQGRCHSHRRAQLGPQSTIFRGTYHDPPKM